MVVDNDEILTWARVDNARIAAVTGELFPGGLEDLNDYSSDDIKDAVKNFRNHTTANRRFNVSAHTTKRLVQLTFWVKDKIRVGHDTTFPDSWKKHNNATRSDKRGRKMQKGSLH